MLTEFQKQKLPRLFEMYDADNNGFIEQADFERFLETYSQLRSWEPGSPNYNSFQSKLMSRWDSMQKFADTNRDNRISLEEWLKYIENILKDQGVYEAEIRGIAGFVFSVFDTNGDDQLDLEEYRQFYRTSGHDENMANEVFKRLNFKDDDSITKEKHIELIDQFFYSEDPEAPGNFIFGQG
ncbi:MAG: hypothetical protein F6K56_23390 [Moorea sp. SIO3G5]|nr:hypothetical protein [Moorena sp. SIO3G5]